MSEPALEALRANFAVHITDPLVGSRGARAGVRPELAIADSGTDCDTFNIVAGARLSGDVESKVALITATFEGRPFSWWVMSGDAPHDLTRHLVASGLQEAEGETLMACRLTGGPARPTELECDLVRDPEGLRAFAFVNHLNWTPPDTRVTAQYDRVAARVLRAGSPFIFLVGRDSAGEPVVAGEGCLVDDVLGIYNISTRAEFRGRGYATAVMTRLMSEGYDRGAKLAVLQASADGLRVYPRLGFAEIGHCIEYKPGG